MSKYIVASVGIVCLVIGLSLGYFISQPSSAQDTTSSEQPPMIMNSSLYTDQQFVADMIVHHEDAVRMSKQVLEHTSRKEVKEMAAAIIEVQTKEIEQLKKWQSEWN